MKFESKRFVYNEKEIPAWVIEVEKKKVTVIQNGDEEEVMQFYSDYIRYHFNYLAETNPDRIQNLIDEDRILEYIDDFDDRCFEAVDKQVELFKKSDRKYKIAAANDNIVEMGATLNNLTAIARQMIMNTMVYV